MRNEQYAASKEQNVICERMLASVVGEQLIYISNGWKNFEGLRL